MLGFGRALGETMAVTMVIGNTAQVSLSLFAPQYTMAAVIANEFTEADTPIYLDALVEIGLVLFIITLIVNSLSRMLIWSMARKKKPAESRRRRWRRRRMNGIAVRKIKSALFVGFCLSVGAAGAHTGRPDLLLRRHRRGSRR